MSLISFLALLPDGFSFATLVTLANFVFTSFIASSDSIYSSSTVTNLTCFLFFSTSLDDLADGLGFLAGFARPKEGATPLYCLGLGVDASSLAFSFLIVFSFKRMFLSLVFRTTSLVIHMLSAKASTSFLTFF